MMRCNTTYTLEGDLLTIVDLNTGGCRHLTDYMEMERALEALDRDGINIEEYQIIIRDHNGLWQGVLLHELRPVETEILYFNARSREDALTAFEKRTKEIHENAGFLNGIPHFESEGGC